MGLIPDYPAPVVVCSTTGTGVQPSILDIESVFANSPGYPPVLQILISNTATVVVNAAMQVSQSSAPALVDPQDVSGRRVHRVRLLRPDSRAEVLPDQRHGQHGHRHRQGWLRPAAPDDEQRSAGDLTMAMVLRASRLRLTQAIYFGQPASVGSGTVTSVAQGNGIANTPNPIVGVGSTALGTLSSNHDFGNFRIDSANSVKWARAAEFATGGDGTSGNPWTSPTGTGGIQEAY